MSDPGPNDGDAHKAALENLADHNKQEYNVNSNVVFLVHRHGKERQVQSSYANNAHCTIAFDLVFKIHESLDIPPSSF
ncbi:hypothetical protein N7501_005273 [Penicillium viridicatum]|nr:hypothetical protein N7501_005273 [Penicillium viridicatum]